MTSLGLVGVGFGLGVLAVLLSGLALALVRSGRETYMPGDWMRDMRYTQDKHSFTYDN